MRALHFNEYLDFSPFLAMSEQDWQQLHYEICLAMSKCQVQWGTGGYQHPTYYPTHGLTGGTYLKNIVHELPEHARATYEKMSIPEKTMFATWFFGYNAMPLIYVRGTTTYETKHTPGGSSENENTPHFAALYSWIERSGLFTQTGRITLFLSPQGYESRKHKDLPPNTPYKAVDEFIWLNPRGKKQFYLEDDDGVRVDMKTRAGWFNSYQYHGAYASQEQNYGLRIDGSFSDAAREYVRARQSEHDAARGH